jgi:hypothetical protein
MVVAVSAAKLNNFRSNCNWQIRISRTLFLLYACTISCVWILTAHADGGHTVVARITDRCAHCDGASLDMSPAVFSSFAPLNLGRLENVEWSFA